MEERRNYVHTRGVLVNDIKGFVIALIGLAILVYGLYGFANSSKFSWNKNTSSGIQMETIK